MILPIIELEVFKVICILMILELCALLLLIVIIIFILIIIKNYYVKFYKKNIGKHKYREHEMDRVGDYHHMTYPK